ncbi:MAG: hypothetical protein ACREQ5_18375, partial [Candidatus Dormibacteria bacterium]
MLSLQNFVRLLPNCILARTFKLTNLCRRNFLYQSLLIAFAAFLSGSSLYAQTEIANIDNTNSVPIPGVGHDYIKMLDETVDPSSGSVSLRIHVPIPPARGLGLPFAFAYDSKSTTQYSPNSPHPDYGAWTFSTPRLGFRELDKTTRDSHGVVHVCQAYGDFIFRDPQGTPHPLGVLRKLQGCAMDGPYQGGDGFYMGNFPDFVEPLKPFTVVANNGTTYQFSNPNNSAGSVTIEDRNG